MKHNFTNFLMSAAMTMFKYIPCAAFFMAPAGFPVRLSCVESFPNGIMIVSVPDNGRLTLNGRTVDTWSVLSAADARKLTLIPSSDGVFDMNLALAVLDSNGRFSRLESVTLCMRDGLSYPNASKLRIETSKNLSAETTINCAKSERFILVSAPSKGQIVTVSDNKFAYIPRKDATGTDSFTYCVEDAFGRKSPPAKATVKIRGSKSASRSLLSWAEEP